MRGQLETEQNCNILTPTLMAITAFLSRSPGLLNQGAGGPASLGHGPHSSIFSPDTTAQSGVLRTPSVGCWFSLPYLNSSWLELPVHGVILLFCAHSIQPVDSQGYPLETFDRMHLLFTQVHFLFWQLGRGQYAALLSCVWWLGSSSGVWITPSLPLQPRPLLLIMPFMAKIELLRNYLY